MLLLGVGEDGHIASLFHNNVALQECKRRVVYITGSKPTFERLTITPPVITQAKSIFVLATGPAKGVILSMARKTPGNFNAVPVRLVFAVT